MKITYSEFTDSLVVDFGLRAGRLSEPLASIRLGDRTMIYHDGEGRVAKIEIIGDTSGSYDLDEVVADGMPSRSVNHTGSARLTAEEFEHWRHRRRGDHP